MNSWPSKIARRIFCCVVLVAGSTVRIVADSLPGQDPAQAATTQTVFKLDTKNAVEQSIRRGEVHRFPITLVRDQQISVSIEDRGINVDLRLRDPHGALVGEVSMAKQFHPIRTLKKIADIPGTYQIEVSAPTGGIESGKYMILLDEIVSSPEQIAAFNEVSRLMISISSMVQKGNTTEGIPLAMRALSLREKYLGPEHPDTAVTLTLLSLLHVGAGEYENGRGPLKQAIEIYEKKPEFKQTPFYALSLETQGLIMLFLGDFAMAEEQLIKLLEFREQQTGRESHEVSMSLNRLAFLRELQGNSEEAAKLLERALQITEKLRGASHVEVAGILSNLAAIYVKLKDNKRALSLFQRALAISEETLGPDHRLVATSLKNLGTLYLTEGNDEKAWENLNKALEVAERALSIEHPLVGLVLESQATLFQRKGKTQEAIQAMARSLEINERSLTRNIVSSSDRQRVNFLTSFKASTDHAISLHTQRPNPDPAAVRLGLNALLSVKGRGLEETSLLINHVRRSSSPEDQKRVSRLVELRKEYANATLRPPVPGLRELSRESLRKTEEEMERLEGELSKNNAEFRNHLRPATINSVQEMLPVDGALIEFAIYRPSNDRMMKGGAPRYIAYVLHPTGEPKWIDLGEATPIDQAIEQFHAAIRKDRSRMPLQLLRRLDQLIAQPVRPLLGSARRVLISPDGAINLVPFAALRDEQNRFLIENYSLTYLTSGRDLLRARQSAATAGEDIVFANPSYGGDDRTLAANRGLRDEQRMRDILKTKRPVKTTSSASTTPSSISLDEIYFTPLPGTSAEAAALQQLLPQARVLTEAQATEKALKQVKGPRILHLATHGFFLKNLTRSAAAKQPENAPSERIENPLIRSGIALTEANLRKGSNEDGILTAMEATSLDLLGTRLVVLSACDTGVGEVLNGEGVQGLRRAFVMAGAESLIMSLWSVPDLSTKDLMVDYYRRLIQGDGRGESLRRVQLQMIKSPKRNHPFYWASFIQYGEWANLDGKR